MHIYRMVVFADGTSVSSASESTGTEQFTLRRSQTRLALPHRRQLVGIIWTIYVSPGAVVPRPFDATHRHSALLGRRFALWRWQPCQNQRLFRRGKLQTDNWLFVRRIGRRQEPYITGTSARCCRLLPSEPNICQGRKS